MTVADIKRPTAKDFQDALLKVLGKLINLRGVPAIPCKDTYEPICKIKGITLEQFGFVTSGGKQTWVERNIQEAFKNLVRQGYGDRKSKGSWGLTIAGMTKVEKIKVDERVVTPMDTGDTVVDPTPTISWAPDNLVYHEDPYIRMVAADNTPCFGKSHTKGGLCDTCPLERDCLNALSTNLTVFSRQLATDDALRAKAALPPAVIPPVKQPAIPPTKLPATPPDPAGKIVLPEGHVEITMPNNGICVTCGKETVRGEKVIWVRGNTGKSPGIYHITCYTIRANLA